MFLTSGVGNPGLPRCPRGPTLQSLSGHQPRNAILTGCFTFICQIFKHAWCSDSALAICVNLTDAAQQTLIIDVPSTRPVVIATGRDLEHPAHHANGKLCATTLNRLILQDDSLAKNIAASRKKSRSFFTRASSRLRRAISSSLGLPVPPKACWPWASASRFQGESRLAPILAHGLPGRS